MGNSQTGGGGSVQWTVNVKRLKRQSVGQNAGRDVQDGADYAGKEGIDYFTVSVKYPNGLQSFKDNLVAMGQTIKFDLLMTGDPRQIEIEWPDN